MTTWSVLTRLWVFDPLALVVCLAVIALAALAWRRSGRRIRALPFAAALLAFVLALASPIERLADGYLFSAHMLQHLLLVLVVPPLAFLGVAPVLEGHAGQVERLLARPLVAWGLGVGAMWLWHDRTLCDAATHSALVHRVQEGSLLVMGTVFWWPILAPREESRLQPLSGVLYLFTACVACTLLGIYITFSPVAVCSIYTHPVDSLGVLPLLRDGWGLTAEKDQQVGGLFMWVPACLVYGIGILGVLARLFDEHGTGEAPLRGAGSTTPPEETRGEGPLRAAGSTTPPEETRGEGPLRAAGSTTPPEEVHP
jgi:cytochrome c oxidase assembly factor CtaG